MSFLPPEQTRELITFASFADKEARSDAARGYIRDEDDYTSNFTGALRRIVNSNSTTGLTANSFLLRPSLERATGTDAAIIITRRYESKIVLFEGKLPRLTSPDGWDYRQTASGLSHFSDQLQRQSVLRPFLAVFEMFYSQMPFQVQPPWMQPEASSCAWHKTALNVDHGRGSKAVWTDQDLEALMRTECLHIRDILTSVCECKAGSPISTVGSTESMAREYKLEGVILQIVAGEEIPLP